MLDQLAERRIVPENRQEWFSMLIAYMQMKTFSLWLRHYPETTWESFLLIWPTLLDRMLASATATAVAKLAEQFVVNLN